jgi:hypothetical protein
MPKASPSRRTVHAAHLTFHCIVQLHLNVQRRRLDALLDLLYLIAQSGQLLLHLRDVGWCGVGCIGRRM